MTLSQKIKLETFCAFVHSRFVGIGQFETKKDICIFKDKSQAYFLNEKGNPIIKYLATIGTLETINKKISDGKSVLIANMYHDNYSKLLKLLEDKVKDGDDVIMSVIGVGLLTCYMEDEKYKKTLDIDLQDLIDIYYFFESKSNKHLTMVREMMKISAYVVEKYFKETKIRK